MKVPRDVDARQLIRAPSTLGYVVTRQTGSHMRLTCQIPALHSLTVPNHSPIKAGTLNAILTNVATQRHIDKVTLINQLFG